MTGGHRRILVVEDDPETAGQLVEELTTSGYEVDLAANGCEALSHGASRDYAVITIDRNHATLRLATALWSFWVSSK